MDTIRTLTESFADFPGIGPRQAKRFVYYLLTRPQGELNELSRLIVELKKSIAVCPSCFRFFSKDHSASPFCSICRDEHRDRSSLMIVSKDADLETIERTRTYSGLYFVLGGTVPILEKNPEMRIRQNELVFTIEKRVAEEGLKEIILAMNFNPEGDNTEEHVRRVIQNLPAAAPIKISILGRGLSTGTELEYSDAETIKNALKNRF